MYQRRGGMTLIEMLMVLLIVAGLAVIGILAFDSLSLGSLKAEALHVAGYMKYARGQAAIHQRHHRVIIDLESQEMWVEVDESAEDGEAGGGRILVDLPPGVNAEPSSTRAYKEDDDPEGGAFGLRRRPYRAVEQKLAKKHKLRSGVRFHSVVTARDERPIEAGRAAIVFYPSGFVQRTAIQLEDDGTFYTLEIQPMSGRVDIYFGKREAGRDFFEVEEDS
jgi:prepilin-type N-terminal cleavage/methylation domain-containing protein